MEEKIVVYPDDVNEYHYNCQVWKFSHGAWWYVMEYAKKRKLLLEFR